MAAIYSASAPKTTGIIITILLRLMIILFFAYENDHDDKWSRPYYRKNVCLELTTFFKCFVKLKNQLT